MSSGRYAVGLALALAFGCGEDDPGREAMQRALGEIIATCSATTGDVQVKRKGEGFWTSALVGSVFRPGDWIQSRAGSYARVEVLGGGALEVDESSQLILDTQEIEGTKSALVAVESGEVRGVIGSTDGGAATPMLFATADGKRGQLEATAGAGPVEFRLTRRQRNTEVAVSSGQATVAFSGSTRTLSAGSAAETDQGALNEVILLRAPAWANPRADFRLVYGAGHTVPMRWEGVEGARRYRLQIARDPAFRVMVVNREIDGTDYIFTPPVPAVFQWRVAARDVEGRQGNWGTPRRLHVDPSPPSEHLLEPEVGATLGQPGDAPIQVAFRWRREPGVEQYRVVIAKTADLEREKRTYPVRGERLEVELSKPGTYYWGVFGDDEDNRRPLFTVARPFTVKRVSASALQAPKKVQNWGE